MSFNIFLIWSSGGPPVQLSKAIYAILKKGIMVIIHVQFFCVIYFLFRITAVQSYVSQFKHNKISNDDTIFFSKMRTFGSGELKIKRVHKLSQYWWYTFKNKTFSIVQRCTIS